MTQADLFTRPLARESDPVSSHAAADRLEQSGALGAQERWALELVTEQPGFTAEMLGRICHPFDPAQAQLAAIKLRKRLPGLRDKGLVVSDRHEDGQRWRRVEVKR